MAKIKLVYEKRSFDVRQESNNPFDYSCCRISDIALPVKMYQHNIEVIKQKKIYGYENLIILKSKDKKKVLKCKIISILHEYFTGKINIISIH